MKRLLKIPLLLGLLMLGVAGQVHAQSSYYNNPERVQNGDVFPLHYGETLPTSLTLPSINPGSEDFDDYAWEFWMYVNGCRTTVGGNTYSSRVTTTLRTGATGNTGPSNCPVTVNGWTVNNPYYATPENLPIMQFSSPNDTVGDLLLTYGHTAFEWYIYEDINGTAPPAIHFTFEYFRLPTFEVTQDAVQAFIGQPISYALQPASEGYKNLTYSVALVNAADGALTGIGIEVVDIGGVSTPVLTANTRSTFYAPINYELTAGDEDDNFATTTFALSVVTPVVFSPSSIQTTYSFGSSAFVSDGTAYTALTIPTAAGGEGTLTYSNAGDPNGLTATELSDNRLVLSGSPAAGGDYTFIRIAHDTLDVTATFTVYQRVNIVAPAFSGTPQPDLSFTAAHPATFTLKQLDANTGTPPVVYTITRQNGDALPNGFTFDSASQELRSTNQLHDSAADDYILTATDADSRTAAITFSIDIAPAVLFADYLSEEYNLALTDQNVSITLPTVYGGAAAITYELSSGGSVIADNNRFGSIQLTYKAATANSPALIEGTANIPTSLAVTYTATDANGATAEYAFTITIISSLTGPVFPFTQPDITFSQGNAQTYILNRALGTGTGMHRHGPFEYTLRRQDGASRSFLHFDLNTRALRTTTQTAITQSGVYILTATDRFNTSVFATTTFTIAVLAAPIFAESLPRTFVFTQAGGEKYQITAIGGSGVLTYSTNPPLPASGANGLQFVEESGETLITNAGGQAAQPLTPYQLIVTDFNSASTERQVAIQILSAADSPAFANAEYAFTFTQGMPQTIEMPQSVGDAVHLIYTMPSTTRTALDAAGLTAAADGASPFTVATDVATAPGTVVATFRAYYQAAGSTAEATITFTVQAPTLPAFAVTQPNLSFTNGTNSTFGINEAIGGMTPYTYSLAPSGGGALPARVMFVDTVPTALTIGGSLELSDGGEYVLTVTDANGATATSTLTIVVVPAPSFSDDYKPFYFGGNDRTTFYRIQAENGVGRLTYTADLSGVNTGVNAYFYFVRDYRDDNDVSLAQINLVNTTPVGEYVFPVTATDENFAAGIINVTFIVTATPTFAADFHGLTFAFGASRTFTLPEAGNGLDGQVRYDITQLGSSINPRSQLEDVNSFTISPIGTQYPFTITSGENTPSGFDATYTLQAYYQAEYGEVAGIGNKSRGTTSIALVVTAPVDPAFETTQSDVSFTATHPTTYTLTEAVGGRYILTYTVMPLSGGALPGGLNFDTDTRELRSTAALATTAGGRYILRASDSVATADRTFSINVAAKLAFSGQANLVYNYAASVNYTLTEANGGSGTVTYSLALQSGAALPATPVFDAATREFAYIADTLTAADVGNNDYVLSATDALGASASTTFNVGITAGAFFTVTQIEPITFTAGTVTDFTLPEASGGATALTYTLTRANGTTPPAGLTLDTTMPILSSSTALTVTATGSYTLSADDGGTPDTLGFDIVVADQPTFAPQETLSYTANRAVTYTLNAASGGAGELVYALTPSASGLEFDAASRELRSDNTLATSVAGDFTFTATDSNGVTAATTFSVAVADPIFLPIQAQDDLSFTIGIAAAFILPTAQDGVGALTYAVAPLSGALPGRLQFTPSSRSLRYDGTSLSASSLMLAYSVIDENGANDAVTFTAQFSNTPSFSGAQATALTDGFGVRVGASIPSDTRLPQASDGSAPLTYQLTANGNSLYTDPAFAADNIVFNPSTRRLSGAPTQAMTYRVTYHVSDRHGAIHSRPTEIRVTAALALAQSNVSLQTGEVGINLPLEQASNPIGDVAYSLTGIGGGAYSLAEGLTFSGGATAQLSGDAPLTASSTDYVLVATDPYDGAKAYATFTIEIRTAPVFAADAIRAAVYTAGNPKYSGADGVVREALTIPPSTQGVGAVAYSTGVGALPTGLTAQAQSDNSVIISGTPTAVGLFTYTRIATDSATPPRSGTFELTMRVVDALVVDDAGAETDFAVPIGSNSDVRVLPEITGGTGEKSYDITPPLPAGLTFIEANGRIRGTLADATIAPLYTITVTDRLGATATFTFTLREAGRLFFTGFEDDPTMSLHLAIGGAYGPLPQVRGGQGPYTYKLTKTDEVTPEEFASGVRFDAATRMLHADEDELVIAGLSELTQPIRYTVTDANGTVTALQLDVTVTPLAFKTQADNEPTRLRFPAGSPQTYQLNGQLNDDDLVELVVAQSDGKNPQVTFSISPTPTDVGLTYYRSTDSTDYTNYSLPVYLASDEQFGQTNDPKVPEYVLTAHYFFQTNQTPATATVTFRIDFTNDPTIIKEVSDAVLSQIAAASTAGTLAAITERIAVGGVPQLSIGGQTPMTALAQNLKEYADGNLDKNALLNGSRFVLPFHGGVNPTISDATVWGSADFREIQGNLSTHDWRGKIAGAHLGFDLKVHNLLVGVAVSQTDASVNYFPVDNGNNGNYDISLNNRWQYVNWHREGVNVWGGIGSGNGVMRVTEEGRDDLTSDLEMDAYNLGASNELSPQVQLRGEWRSSELQIDGARGKENRLAQQTINSTTTRALLKWHDRLPGDQRAVFVEMGFRSDGGDGPTGTAIETAIGGSYQSERATFEYAAHGLIGRDNYEEWGGYGQFRYGRGGEPGLAVQVRPSYGETQNGFGRVWDAESIGDIDGEADDSLYQWRTESRVSYGFQSAHGMLAPFGEFITADEEIFRLGLDWSPHRYFDLNLTGEQLDGRHRDAERRLLLQGAVKF